MTREPVRKAIDVLRWMADHPHGPWSLRQIARDTGMTPPTVHRILQIFESANLVSRDVNGCYTGGLELHHVAQGLASAASLVTIARPHLARLAEECRETVLLGSYDYRAKQMRFIDMVESTYPLRYVVELQQLMPVHTGATGLAILAFLDEDERQAVYRQGLPQLTEETLNDVRQIEEVVASTRARQFLCTRGQRINGAVGLASPVFDALGKVIGDICVTIPDPRFEEQLEPHFERLIKEAAAGLTRDLRQAGLRASPADPGEQQESAPAGRPAEMGTRSA